MVHLVIEVDRMEVGAGDLNNPTLVERGKVMEVEVEMLDHLLTRMRKRKHVEQLTAKSASTQS